MKPDSNSSVHTYAAMNDGSSVQGVSGTTFLNKMPRLPQFSGTERETDTVSFEQWLHLIFDARKTFNEQIGKSCHQ